MCEPWLVTPTIINENLASHVIKDQVADGATILKPSDFGIPKKADQHHLPTG
jgi:hypothetical protein